MATKEQIAARIGEIEQLKQERLNLMQLQDQLAKIEAIVADIEAGVTVALEARGESLQFTAAEAEIVKPLLAARRQALLDSVSLG